MVKLIVAIGPDGLIGKGNKMPWHIPDEYKHFKETTMGHTLFMGGTTLNGLPGTLPGRDIVALSLVDEPRAKNTLHSIEEAKAFLESYKNSKDVVFIAGGKFIYETFQEYADEMIISHVETKSKGDVFLHLDFTKYENELVKKAHGYSVYRYFRA